MNSRIEHSAIDVAELPSSASEPQANRSSAQPRKENVSLHTKMCTVECMVSLSKQIYNLCKRRHFFSVKIYIH